MNMTRRDFCLAATAAASVCGALGERAIPGGGKKRWYRGDFYAASEQDLEDVSFDRASGTLKVSVPATPGVAFKIRFITTKKGAPLDPVRYVEIPPTKEHFNRARKVPVYDARIGATIKLVEGKKGERLEASYALAADDLYVRARVESDAPTKFKRKRCLHPAHHTAWTQPYSC